MTTKRFYRRRFLNKRGHHAGAYVIAKCRIDAFLSVIDVFESGAKNLNFTVDATLTVADCGRIASLDFHAYDEATAANALYKARLLRDIVVDFTDALEASVEEWRRRRAEQNPGRVD